MFLLIQSFQFLPTARNIINSSSAEHQLIFSDEGRFDRGLGYFLAVQPYVKLVDNISNQPQYLISIIFDHAAKNTYFDYGIKYQYLFFIYILIIIAGFILIKAKGKREERLIYLSMMGIFLLLLLLMTANINPSVVEVYKKLFSVPGFAMFRSFYTKFNVIFVFFYALLLGTSLYYLLDWIKFRLVKSILLAFVVFLMAFNSWPLLSGMIVNFPLWLSKGVKSSIEMNKDYLNFIDKIKDKKLEAKYLSLPFTNEEYQVLQGENGGAYMGPSSIAILAGKNDFNSFYSFGLFKNLLGDSFKDPSLVFFKRLLPVLNVGKVVYDSNNYIYDNFPSHPYVPELKEIFPNQDVINKFVEKLDCIGNEKINDFKLYSYNNFLPKFYTPTNIVSTTNMNLVNAMYNYFVAPVGNYQIRTVFYSSEQDQSNKSVPGYFNLELITSTSPLIRPILEFKKINTTEYRMIIHHAVSKVPLIFSESFDDGWKIYLENINSNYDSQEYDKLSDYKILDGNVDDQATKEELGSFINQGLISNLGDGNCKVIRHEKWENNKQVLDYNEGYKIDFISKNFQDTIQNNNLPDGNLYETWLKKPIADNAGHLMANGYANSWLLDVEKICYQNSSCKKNSDGSYDLEVVVEFWPQRLFYLGLFISGTILIGCLGYLGWDFYRRRKTNLALKDGEQNDKQT